MLGNKEVSDLVGRINARVNEEKKEKWKKMAAKFKIPEPIKEQWEVNPLVVIGVLAAALTAASRLIDSLSGVQSRRAYAKQSNRRSKTKR